MHRDRETVGEPAFTEGRVAIDTAGAGDTILVTGVAGRKIRVYQLVLWAQAAVTVILKDGATAINGSGFNFATQQGFVYDATKPLVCAAGNDFVLNLSGAFRVTGWALYSQTA